MGIIQKVIQEKNLLHKYKQKNNNRNQARKLYKVTGPRKHRTSPFCSRHQASFWRYIFPYHQSEAWWPKVEMDYKYVFMLIVTDSPSYPAGPCGPFEPLLP